MGLPAGPDAIATLMASFRGGDSQSAGQLLELLYPEVRRMAARQMRLEGAEHSWQPTLLVNELYLEMCKIKGLPAREGESDNEKAAFLGLAGHIMKRLLIRHARPLSARALQIELPDGLPVETDTTLLEMEDLLSRLGEVKPEMRTVVEMKVFYGMTAEEIAERLGCATVSVNRYWQFARRWLRQELGE